MVELDFLRSHLATLLPLAASMDRLLLLAVETLLLLQLLHEMRRLRGSKSVQLIPGAMSGSAMPGLSMPIFD